MLSKSNTTKQLLDLMLFTPRIFRHENCDKKPTLFKLTPVQLRTLIFTSQKKQVNLKEIADFLGITPPTASVLVDHLEKHKMLSRHTQDDDRRFSVITITNNGQKHANQLIAFISRKIDQSLKPLTEKEKQTLFHLLKKISLNQ